MSEISTIYDVARLSGVSTATVSRAFSNPDHVREATRRKVYEAAEMLHYSPNAIARAMARQRTDKIAYLICKKGATILDEFYAGICEGVMRTVNQMDYQLVISTEEDWQLAGGSAQSKQIEGVILAGYAQPSLVSELQAQNVSVVLVNNRMAGFDLPCVVADERSGIAQAVDHLAERGHHHIALLAGRINPYIVAERYRAFLDRMRDHGLEIRPSEVKMCAPTVEDAAKAAEELLTQPGRPEAVLCTNDAAAAGVYKAALRLGLRIPEDLAVTGFDDSSACTLLEPELTSVRIPCRRMGELCVERLAALLEKAADVPRLTVVPTELCVRRST